MIKTLIFTQFFVRVLFVFAGAFLFATIFIAVMEKGVSPESTASFAGSLSAFVFGKKIQFAR